MKPFVAITLVALIVCTVSAEEKKPADALRGEWKVTALTAVGTDLPKDEVEKMTVVVEDNVMTLKFPKTDKSLDITMKFDPKAEPATIDLTWTEGGKEATVPGIYKIEKGTLTICYEHNTAGVRPKEFKSEDGGRTVLMVLERAKK